MKKDVLGHFKKIAHLEAEEYFTEADIDELSRISDEIDQEYSILLGEEDLWDMDNLPVPEEEDLFDIMTKDQKK